MYIIRSYYKGNKTTLNVVFFIATYFEALAVYCSENISITIPVPEASIRNCSLTTQTEAGNRVSG
jgi:hypothetical protein